MCARKMMENDSQLERCPLALDTDNIIESKQVIIIEVNDNCFYLTGFLNVLYNNI